MIPVTVVRRPSQPPLDTDTLFYVTLRHYHEDPQIRDTWGSVGAYQKAMRQLFVEPQHRAESYLYDSSGVKPIAMAAYARVLDIHYGMMAQPILIFIDHEYRGDLKVTRAVSKMVKEGVRKLEVSWYSVSKHPTPDIQQSVTRRI